VRPEVEDEQFGQALAAFDPEAAIDVVRDIIAVESIWGNEAPLAEHLAERFGSWGLTDVRLVDEPKGRPSVVGRVPGNGGGRTLLFLGHLDMYELASDWTLDPWALTGVDGRLHGGGIADMKGGLAAIAAAARFLAATQPALAGDVIVAGVAAHFEGDVGTRAILDSGVRADGAIVAEPSQMRMVVAHRGAAYFDITVFGKQAHTIAADQGINAITKMAKVIRALEELRLAYEPHPLLPGAPLMNIGTIRGGTKHNQVPDRCTISVDFRLLPSQDPYAVREEVTEALERLRSDDPELRYEVAFSPHWLSGPRVPFQVDPGWEIPKVVESAYAHVTGQPVERTGLAYWTGMAVLAPAGIECVNIGPGGAPYNFADEYILEQEYFDAIKTYMASAYRFCRAQSG
jgi:acetylornithine deacetylase/succinyl-diaminopimelate desuccinylase-like protein